MFSFINIPARILAILELNISPAQVAGGVCLGMFLGFIPLNRAPIAILLFLFFFITKINRFSTALTLPLFKLLYLLGVSHLTDKIGGYLLIDASYLVGFWRVVTHLPVLALLDLNNTLVAGGLALSLVLTLPVFLIARLIYVKFIAPVLRKIQETKLAKRITANKLAAGVVKNMDKVRSRTE